MKVRSGLIQMALKGDTNMSPEEITKKMTEAQIQKAPFMDRVLGKITSRKLLVWGTGTVLAFLGFVTSSDWVTISMVYIGSQAAVDVVVALKNAG